jgi:hypothetical protein
MKPQLVTTQDFAGYHNGDLQAASARLIKGGSWKRQRIVCLIPASDAIPTKVALSMWNLAFPPNNGVVRIAALGMEVGEAYSTAITQVLADPNLSEWEYLLTLEHDNLAAGDAVLKLLERMEQHPELACIGGLYFTKGVGGVPQIWGDVRDPVPNYRPQLPDPNGGLVECVGTGMGFNLWRMAMFKDERLRRPWFVTQREGGISTQDLYFWGDARKYGYRCAVDCSVKVGHLDLKGEFGEADFVW